ncbi:hypothetical protein ASE66_23820 [Bosea sp. Root483D1]|uniref:hypothetical protein n=1 Tax=Bosea sp. Root483D1 TaxID=1736544 RepID=UPI00070B6C83|nr:hypothetical protein [Bosea sp. Root483D1]KRE11569.1 hypothetical protein ASE66_23820 [Bosea sp. Root483D1]
MAQGLLKRFAAKIRSMFTSAARNLVFLEGDTGDIIEARLQEVEREIVALNGQTSTQPMENPGCETGRIHLSAGGSGA